MLLFSQPSCYSNSRPPSYALGTSFYTISEGSDLMAYVSDNYTSYSAPSRLRPWTNEFIEWVDITIQCTIFKCCKCCRFRCFPLKCDFIFCKIIILTYLQIYSPQKIVLYSNNYIKCVYISILKWEGN